MGTSLLRTVVLTVGFSAAAGSMLGDPVFHFSTGDPDGLMATATRPAGTSIEIESADDFVTTATTTIDHATFTGLITPGTPLSDITQVVVEVYRVFPLDSTNPPSGHVLTRVNSPSDVAFDSRDSAGATLTFTVSVLSATFTAGNSVMSGGIHPLPNQTTGGDGAVTGQEVLLDVTFTPPLVLPADHYFFVPQVLLAMGTEDFFWLSAPKPIVPPGTPFSPDLQSWTRDANLAPDWSRIGTDIVGGTTPPTFNASFSLDGSASAVLAVTPLGVAASEGGSFSGAVANFTDSDATQPASNFTATIDWGDGASTAGTITGASGSFTVTGTHTYPDEGSFTLTTTVTDIANAVTAAGVGTAAVAETDALTGAGLAIAATRGAPFSGAVATFSDTNTANVASDFTATIAWGDGNTTAGTVAGAAGAFTVSGSHIYTATGAFALTVTLSDDAPGTATATVTGAATVAAGSATAVPAVDGFGLVVLVLSLVATGMWTLRSR